MAARKQRSLVLCGLLLSGASILTGCAGRNPGRIETSLMTTAKHRLTIGGKGNVNPISATPADIANGQKIFGYYCTVCHGLDGQNTGVPFADKMSPPVPLLNSSEVQKYSDGQLKWIIENGIFPSGMPSSRGVLNDEEMWQIVLYLRHLPQKGSLGEPAVYSAKQ